MATQTTLAKTMSFIGVISQPRVVIVGLAIAQLLYDVLRLGKPRLTDDYSTFGHLYGVAVLAWFVVASAKQSSCEWRAVIAAAMVLNVGIDALTAASDYQSTVTQWIWLIDAAWLAGAILLFPSKDQPNVD